LLLRRSKSRHSSPGGDRQCRLVFLLTTSRTGEGHFRRFLRAAGVTCGTIPASHRAAIAFPPMNPEVFSPKKSNHLPFSLALQAVSRVRAQLDSAASRRTERERRGEGPHAFVNCDSRSAPVRFIRATRHLALKGEVAAIEQQVGPGHE